MYENLRDEAGDVIAWLSDNGCENPRCKAARAAGRPVHIIPARTDPRAGSVTLALREYHFATPGDAAAALEAAWETAPTVFTVADRDAAYASGGAVKIAHDLRG